MKIKRGQILKDLRLAKGLNQSRLAELLGVSLTAYQKYEHGTAEPNFDNLSKLADFYNVSTDYLLGRRQNEPEEARKKMSVEEMENDIVNRWLNLGEIGREVVYNMLRSMVDLAEAKKQEEISQQAPEPPKQRHVERLGDIEDALKQEEEAKRKGAV